jgi:hypothetical protein
MVAAEAPRPGKKSPGEPGDENLTKGAGLALTLLSALTATLLATLASRFLLLLAGLLLAGLLLSAALSAALLTALSALATLVLATLTALSTLLTTLARILICHWNRSPREKVPPWENAAYDAAFLGLFKET